MSRPHASIALVLVLSACSTTHAVRHPGRATPLAYLLADAAVAGVGLAMAVDGYNRPDATAQTLVGFSLFCLVWCPAWVVTVDR